MILEQQGLGSIRGTALAAGPFVWAALPAGNNPNTPRIVGVAAMCWFSLIWKNRLVELANKGTFSFKSWPLYC
jgi:hypothetical protein